MNANKKESLALICEYTCRQTVTKWMATVRGTILRSSKLLSEEDIWYHCEVVDDNQGKNADGYKGISVLRHRHDSSFKNLCQYVTKSAKVNWNTYIRSHNDVKQMEGVEISAVYQAQCRKSNKNHIVERQKGEKSASIIGHKSCKINLSADLVR